MHAGVYSIHSNTDILLHCGARVGRGRAGNFQVLQGAGEGRVWYNTGGHRNVGQYFSTASNRGGLFRDAIKKVRKL